MPEKKVTNTKNKHVAKKRFGQNFLVDENYISKIVNAINIKNDDNILEIGPGLGALTKHLLPKCKFLNLVEIDKDVIEHLNSLFESSNNINIYREDFLKFDLNKIFESGFKNRVIGNLPYNISTPIIFKLIDNISNIQDMHFMLQKEVADRLKAMPGSKIYGRLSVMVQYFCDVKSLITVPAGAFSPKPKVTSAFIRISPRSSITVVAKSIKSLQLVTTTAFSKRRKTIANSLKGLIAADLLQEINIDPSKRPEQLSVNEFVLISNQINTK